MFENMIVIPDCLQELSDECMARHMLYAQADAVKNTGSAYSVAFASSFNRDLPRLLRMGRVNVCVFSPETQGIPEGAFYLLGVNLTERVLGYKPAAGEELGTMEEMIEKLSGSLEDFPVIAPENEKIVPIRDEEEALMKAEAYDTVASVLYGKEAHTETFENEWLSLLTDGVISENVNKIAEEAKAVCDKDIKDIIRFGSDNIELDCLKMCEDGSDDVVIRIHETQGKNEVRSFIMSDMYEMGFWFDINAYEIMTFRVNSEGMVRQTNFAEGIIPFNNFEW